MPFVSLPFVDVLTTFSVLIVCNEITILNSVLDGEPMIGSERHAEQIVHGAQTFTVLTRECLDAISLNQPTIHCI